MTTLKNPTAMQDLFGLGQSVWLDDLGRGLIRSGELQALIDRGLRGMTSNPSIFQRAIAGTGDYDVELQALATSPLTDVEIFERLALEDVRQAADLFRPLHEASAGRDGFVSLEVSPRLARDTVRTVAEARRLWSAVGRPNVMIKVPGTREGWPAIEKLLTDGINVNITLLFSREHYRQVALAWQRALEARRLAGLPVDRVASVASFFVSRVDTETDRRLEAAGGSATELRGTVAIANAQLAYAWFSEQAERPEWQRLAQAGARPQRLLWASTGTKNPAYSDVLYVDRLIGPHTINTVPLATLHHFEEHGTLRNTLPGDVPSATRVMDRLAQAGIDLDDITAGLEADGIAQFSRALEALLQAIARRRQEFRASRG